jgi:hypothetical protein
MKTTATVRLADLADADAIGQLLHDLNTRASASATGNPTAR